MEKGTNLYMDGEERFGFFSSLFYPVFNAIPTARRFYDFVISELNEKSFGSLLDVGSGRGTVLVRLARKKTDATLLGIDPSPYMINFANRSAAKARVSDRVKFMIGNSRSLVPGRKFDLIMSSLSFHHWKDREAGVSVIVNALQPGGEFVVFEITNNGEFDRRFVKSHLMSRAEFFLIGSKIGISPQITEEGGFISASFRN